MSRRGNCYDNAAMESWFSTLKSELGERFETHAAAKEQLFDYIEVFYNQQRLHSAIGLRQPGRVRAGGAAGEASGVVNLSAGPDQAQLAHLGSEVDHLRRVSALHSRRDVSRIEPNGCQHPRPSPSERRDGARPRFVTHTDRGGLNTVANWLLVAPDLNVAEPETGRPVR
ncbi:integrase core domain-containing protein [Anaeromyxobacter sp. PSR-1]|uniref:integrase core domain-containing protein n=1 Tax=Anaeromyxobacter sp. PSR-1 TaxID=1300915 RepID=UPI001364CAE4|nr:integrase core domain-containing protein [Anaeromyxobacter sp. PSR-1]